MISSRQPYAAMPSTKMATAIVASHRPQWVLGAGLASAGSPDRYEDGGRITKSGTGRGGSGGGATEAGATAFSRQRWLQRTH